MGDKTESCPGRAEGSFTIEASLIMPMILGIIVMLIYFAMAAHDRCVIEHVCCLASSEAAGGEKSDEEAAALADEELDRRLICTWDTDITVYSDEEYVWTKISVNTFGKAYTHASACHKLFLPDY
ncbi:MAG: pilus assembly protein [Lachnospiraceae bacterium]|nr:pilus assembly protein [Lachnospiraceae bacterium]